MQAFELENPQIAFEITSDSRLRMTEPIPVTLEAVDDMRLPRPTLDGKMLKLLYADIIGLQLEPNDGGDLCFRSGNYRLRFDLPQGTARYYRPLRIVVPSLRAIEHRLVEREIEYERQKGLAPGGEILALQDIEGNYLEIRQHRAVV